MTHAQLSGEVSAPPEAVYALVADPTRLREWDVSFGEATPIGPGADGEPTFSVERTVANRGMKLACRVVRAEPGRAFAFECRGSAGELVREAFALRPGKDGRGTTVARESEVEYPGQDLGVVAQTTYVEAVNTRSAEQAFARLNLLLGGDTGAAPAAPADTTDTRSTDSGPIAAEEQYSAHPGSPAVPDRPT